jgi:hypothetical protein
LQTEYSLWSRDPEAERDKARKKDDLPAMALKEIFAEFDPPLRQTDVAAIA